MLNLQMFLAGGVGGGGGEGQAERVKHMLRYETPAELHMMLHQWGSQAEGVKLKGVRLRGSGTCPGSKSSRSARDAAWDLPTKWYR